MMYIIIEIDGNNLPKEIAALIEKRLKVKIIYDKITKNDEGDSKPIKRSNWYERLRT